MARYRDPPSRAERATAIAAVAAVHLALGLLALRSSTRGAREPTDAPIRTFDVALPQPPPPPPPPPERAAERAAGAPAREAQASPILAPAPRVELPPRATIVTAPLPGIGTMAAAGAATSGSGSGAGGAGSGAGGGGAGAGAGGGIGEDARLLTGGLGRRDYRRLRAFAVPSGRAVLGLLVGPDGRVANCTVRQSSGDATLDAALCALLQPRMQWAPARDRAGRPLTVGIVYTAVWSRD